jgi:hypothetical protein
MVTETHQELPRRLRRLRARLKPLVRIDSAPESARVAGEALKLLDRDLLPRTAGAAEYLVAGIVGPNNAGKSALFNALAGTALGSPLSPSIPTGGATRRLLGAAHPELITRMEGEPTLARFPIRRVKAEAGGVRQALESGADPAELLIVSLIDLPPDVLLIDTPDFDSILVENRRVSESLLRVADLALVVVTRHTYQNKEVVNFLREWLTHGRPWALVYNESLGPEITREHADKLAADMGRPPIALFHAPFDIEVQRGTRELSPTALAAEGLAEGTPLANWLFGLGQARELKGRALASSLEELEVLLVRTRRALASEVERAHELLKVAHRRALPVGEEVARQAMPMGPFLEAFRAVLDRRPNLWQRGMRGSLRKARLLAERAIAALPYSRKPSATPAPESRLADVEAQKLLPLWPVFFESLAIELGPGGRAWDGRESPDAELSAALAADLTPSSSVLARDRALEALSADPEVLGAFQEACEELIDRELENHGGEWLFQIAIDVLHLFPVIAAGIVIFKAGGIGADVAVASAGTLSSLVAEKLSRLLGSDVARRARERWTGLRRETLARLLVESALSRSAAILMERGERGEGMALALRENTEESGWKAAVSKTE